MSGLNCGNFAPGRQLRWGRILPGLAGISRYVDQTVVSSGPDGIGILEGRSHSVNYPMVFALFWVRSRKHSQIRRGLIRFPRQIGADHFPTFPRVHGFKQNIGRKEKFVRVERRKDNREGAIVAIFTAMDGFGRDVRNFA